MFPKIATVCHSLFLMLEEQENTAFKVLMNQFSNCGQLTARAQDFMAFVSPPNIILDSILFSLTSFSFPHLPYLITLSKSNLLYSNKCYKISFGKLKKNKQVQSTHYIKVNLYYIQLSNSFVVYNLNIQSSHSFSGKPYIFLLIPSFPISSVP